MYTRLSELIEEGKGYLSVLYNLGLAVISATLLGMLMSQITDLLTHEQLRSDSAVSGEKGEEEQ